MNLLTINNFSKSYTDRMLFLNASFSINQGEKIGVIGINGMGKSTLLKIVAGVEEPDEGAVVQGRNLKIRYLSQNPVLDKAQSVIEAVLAGNRTSENEWSVESEAKSILNQLDVLDINQPVGQLSGGQKKRVALANILLGEADILVLDEPTNHLDNRMAGWLEQYLLAFRGALLMVTHDRYFLDRVSNRIVEVDQGNVYSYPGNYSEFVRLKEARMNMELASERKRQSILKKELEWLARGARARSTKQKAHIDRIEQMAAQQAPEAERLVKMGSVSSRMGKRTVELEHITKAYGGRTLIQDFSYIFLKNDRIGIIGPNGCGKSTLMKIINGNVEPDAGSVEIGQTIKIGYFSQENEALDESLKAIEYVREGAEYIRTEDGNISASQMLERFLFDGSMQWSRIEKLSGGEKRRLYLLRILMEAPNVLILDEPTNDLDIQTLSILEDYLDNFEGIVITVSHDRYFLDRIARRIFAFEEDGKLKQYEGGYSDYLFACEENQPVNRTPEKEKSAETSAKNWKTPNKKLKFSFKEQREYETIDDDIAGLEQLIQEKEKEIAAAASNYMELNRLMDEKQLLEKELEEKTERWVYLNDLAERIDGQV